MKRDIRVTIRMTEDEYNILSDKASDKTSDRMSDTISNYVRQTLFGCQTNLCPTCGAYCVDNVGPDDLGEIVDLMDSCESGTIELL